jgi:hypothetical protein
MKKIDTVLMVRHIRDKQSKEISNKTHQEIIEYFREMASGLKEKVTNSQLKQANPR